MPAGKDVTVDIRNIAKEHFALTVQVRMKNAPAFRFGLWLVRLGCRIARLRYVEEFPMTLIQDGKPVEME